MWCLDLVECRFETRVLASAVDSHVELVGVFFKHERRTAYFAGQTKVPLAILLARPEGERQELQGAHDIYNQHARTRRLGG